MIAGLAFVPDNRVIDALKILETELPDALQPVIDYFEDTYIGRPQCCDHRAPKYVISIWHVNDHIWENIPRTSNAAEAFHRHMQASARVQACHPNIWTFPNSSEPIPYYIIIILVMIRSCSVCLEVRCAHTVFTLIVLFHGRGEANDVHAAEPRHFLPSRNTGKYGAGNL